MHTGSNLGVGGETPPMCCRGTAPPLPWPTGGLGWIWVPRFHEHTEMPTFCRHNRLVQNCAICSREQHVEMRPVVTSSAPKSTQPREKPEAGEGGSSPRPARAAGRGTTGSGGSGNGSGVRVRRMARGAEDGFSSRLVPGLKSSEDAARLAEELVFAAMRLERLSAPSPPGLFAAVAGVTEVASDIEERAWLAFLIAYLGPLEPADDGAAGADAAASADGADASAGADPFAAIGSVRVPWVTVDTLDLDGVAVGPRGAHTADRGLATVEAYRAWAARAGSQAAAFTGEPSWTAERRFERIFERLGTLPGMTRDARFELLTLLGRLGVFELRAGKVFFGGENETTWAGKRAFGIGDQLLLERRAAELAAACELPIAALDLGLHNWGSGQRLGDGIDAELELDDDALALARDALRL